MVLAILSSLFIGLPVAIVRATVVNPVLASVHYATLPLQHLMYALLNGLTFLYHLSLALEDIYVFLATAALAGAVAGLCMFAVNHQLSALVFINRNVRNDSKLIDRRPAPLLSPVKSGRAQTVDPSNPLVGEFLSTPREKPTSPSVNTDTIFEEDDEASDF